MTFQPKRLTEYETHPQTDEGEDGSIHTPVEEAKTTAESEYEYEFPWRHKLIPGRDHAKLIELLDKAVSEISEHGYPKYRQVFCQLSESLNIMGLQAPAFRPQPTIPYQVDLRTPEHLLIQRDRVVIDCHWLYCTKSKVYANEGRWKGMLNPKLSLQTDRIEKFAATKVHNTYRANSSLNLSEFQQTQMAAIRDEEMQKRFKALGAMVTGPAGKRTLGHFKRVDRAILEWSNSQPRFEKHYNKHRAYAMAAALLEKATVPQLAKLAGFILGKKPLSDSSARQTIAMLEKLVSKV